LLQDFVMAWRFLV